MYTMCVMLNILTFSYSPLGIIFYEVMFVELSVQKIQLVFYITELMTKYCQ